MVEVIVDVVVAASVVVVVTVVAGVVDVVTIIQANAALVIGRNDSSSS